MISLKLRLLLGAIIGVLLALTVAAFILVAAFETHVRARYVDELDEHLHQLIALVQIDAAGTILLRHELYNQKFQLPFSGLYWQIGTDEKVVLRSKSLWDNELATQNRVSAPGSRNISNITGPRRQRLIGVERRVVLDGRSEQALRLVVAGESRVVEESRAEFSATVAYLLFVIGTLLTLASWFQVRTGLLPLTALRTRLDDLRRGRTERIDGRFPDEIAGLVDDLNRLTATQAKEVERARANAAKLGHGLKTPLAVLAAECRSLRTSGETAAADVIETEIEEMNAHVARVIAAARAIGPRKALGSSIAIASVLQRMISVMKRLPRGSDIEWNLCVAPPALTASIDQRDFEELMGNLLDNARKWAKRRVDIDVRSSGSSLEIKVDDDGPGIPADRRSDVLAGGFRLDRTVPGTGIGLAISSDLAILHGGQLRIEPSAIGGTRIVVGIGDAARSA